MLLQFYIKCFAAVHICILFCQQYLFIVLIAIGCFCILKSTANVIDKDVDLVYDLTGLKNEIVDLENDVFDPSSNIFVLLDDVLGHSDVVDLGLGINVFALADE